MAKLLLTQIKKQTSSFLHEKYNSARMVFTDVTPAELLAEEATNSDPCSPDARTMTRIAVAAFDMDDYWRISDVLHRRLYNFDWKQWRQSYKALVLLDFLLTHGPEEFAEEFLCDSDIIQELAAFTYKDENGFDWGLNMRKKSERILELLQGGDILKQERLHALKITNEIQGFGSTNVSPSSSVSSPSSSRISNGSSFGSFSTSSSEVEGFSKNELIKVKSPAKQKFEGLHNWDSHTPIAEKDSLLNSDEEEVKEENNNNDNDNDNDNDIYNCSDSNEYGEQRLSGFLSGIISKFGNVSPSRRDGNYGERVNFRSLSDVSNKMKVKRMERQHSTKY